jgi:hypothetical protein
MDIVVNEALKAYIDPLTPDEHAALERSLLAEGCRDALVLWGNVLVDGHNRFGLCQKHGLPFQTVQNPRFKSIEDVQLWMIDQHLGRRSLSDFQRGVLAIRKRDMLAERRAQATVEVPAQPAPEAAVPDAPAAPAPEPLSTREALARAARLSSSQVQQIEKIQKQGAPELVNAVKTGLVSLNGRRGCRCRRTQAGRQAGARCQAQDADGRDRGRGTASARCRAGGGERRPAPGAGGAARLRLV